MTPIPLESLEVEPAPLLNIDFASEVLSDDEDEDGSSAGHLNNGGFHHHNNHNVNSSRTTRPSTDVARKVRESIRLSKASGDGGDSGKGGLDVELVEMLLGELEVTKREMKDLQEKYNAFRVRFSLALFRSSRH